ncbi:hypothetical protein DFH09DRAFT_1330168 [Mycena vulgaris]|nr:hypothetical protein DFH09DRAFT_1330168 [Mycena vulgaris]
MNTTTTTTPNPAPNIDSATLPQTPSDEWAQNTKGRRTKPPPRRRTRGRMSRGGFPRNPQRHQQRRGAGETLMATAKAYLPAQDDVQRAMTSAPQAAKAYLLQGVAAYLQAQAGSMGPPHLYSPSPSTPNTDLDNLSTLVHTGGPASLHPVTPLGSRFAENLVTPPGLASAPNLSDAGPVIPPPPTSTTDTQRAGPNVAAPSPYGVLAPSQSHYIAPAEPPAPAVDVDAEEGSRSASRSSCSASRRRCTSGMRISVVYSSQ